MTIFPKRNSISSVKNKDVISRPVATFRAENWTSQTAEEIVRKLIFAHKVLRQMV